MHLTGDESLLQASAHRLSGPDYAAPVVMTNSDFRVITTGQLASVAIDPGTILIEPEGRNTAPAVQAGVPAAQNGQLVAFGIKPTRPETGYGYLELTGAPADYTTEPMALSRFVENPDAERAAKMLTTDHFL